MLGLDISRKQLGDDCNLKGIMSHLYIHFETIVARSSKTRCQKFEEYVLLEYICWDWIYHANSWEMIVI